VCVALYCMCAGDTRPVQSLIDLALSDHPTDLLILQNQGPIRDPASLSYETQLLLNVRHLWTVLYHWDTPLSHLMFAEWAAHR
jgi:hypothetical protein